MLKGFTIGSLCLALAFPVFGQGQEAALTDHPLISAYEGSDLRRKDVKEFDEYNAFTGMDESGEEPTGIALQGKVTRILYKQPGERSILEVFRNYEMAITESGAEILFQCNQEESECAARYAGPTMLEYSDIQSVSNLAGRYLLARFDEADHVAFVAVAVGQTFTDIHVVEVMKMMDTGMVMLDAAAMSKGIDAEGYVIVDGIYFDTDRATLKSESSAAIEQIWMLLQSRPDLDVYVVGHTDTEGSLAHNQALSEARAKAVVDELADLYGVSHERMSGHGVGPLAPQATNSSDSGRAMNRRVVLVAR